MIIHSNFSCTRQLMLEGERKSLILNSTLILQIQLLSPEDKMLSVKGISLMLKTLPPEDTVWTSKENTSDVKWTLQRATPLEEVFTLSCHTTKVHELHGLCLPWECDKSVLSSSTSQRLNNVGLD